MHKWELQAHVELKQFKKKVNFSGMKIIIDKLDNLSSFYSKYTFNKNTVHGSKIFLSF